MASTPESRVVDRIRTAILRKYPDAFVVKIAGGGYQSAGLPDLVVILRGRAIGLEVKAQRSGESEDHARGRATLRQQAVLQQMRRAGAIAEVVLGPEEVMTILETV